MWTAGEIGVAVLFAVLFCKGAAKVFPWFTAWCTYQFCVTLLLYYLYRAGSLMLYSKVYWYGQILELVLQLAVIVNMALLLFRPRAEWIPGTKRLVYVGAGLALAAAGVLTIVAEPNAPTAELSWLIRGNLFSAVLTTELSLAVITTAYFLSLSWRQWVTGMAIGLVLRFAVACLVEGAHTYFGEGTLYKVLDHIRMYAEIAALLFWTVSFSRKEPERRPLTPEMIETLTRLGGTR